jgi:hypothetical protein
MREDDLSLLRQLVVSLEAALEEGDFRGGRIAANQLATATTRLITQLQHDPSIDAELSAALQVFRNAAFAFRRLSKAGGPRDGVIATTCATLIAQGNDLLQVYFSARERDGDERHSH